MRFQLIYPLFIVPWILCVCACTSPTAPPADDAPAVDTAQKKISPAPPSPEKAPLASRGPIPSPDAASATDDGIVTFLRTAPIVGAQIVSKRSLSIKLYLKGGHNAIFKPFRKNNETARHEVAFYRLATLLQVQRVPPATIRRIPLVLLEGLISRRSPELSQRLAAEVRTDSKGLITGAVMLWLDDLEPSGLEGNGRIDQLLSGQDRTNPISDSVAKMAALDYVGGNWDRLSGGNLYRLKNEPVLALIDNNNSFAKWSEGQQARMTRLVSEMTWMPQDFLVRLKALDAKTISDAMACDTCGLTVLFPAEIGRALERRDALLASKDFDAVAQP